MLHIHKLCISLGQSVGTLASRNGKLGLVILKCKDNRLNLWAGHLENRVPPVYYYNGLRVDNSFIKQWQSTERINCQEYREQLTKDGVDC